MHHGNRFAISRGFTVGLILSITFVMAACRSSQPPDSTTNSQGTPQTESDSKVGNARIADLPLFAGRIENVSMYPVPNRDEDLAISLVVSVKNAGSPSVAQGWNLEVSSPIRRVNIDPVHVNGLVDMPGIEGKKIDLGKEDLALKTAQVQINKGTRVNGILTFVLPKTTQAELADNSTRLIVHFKDTQGNSFQTPPIVVGKKANQSK
jgi:hypothetical protein